MTKNDPKTQRRICNIVITRAADLMAETGAPIPMILDRLITFAAAQACVLNPDDAARLFRHVADEIDAGVFDHVAGANQGVH